jgi:hypothetical protein
MGHARVVLRGACSRIFTELQAKEAACRERDTPRGAVTDFLVASAGTAEALMCARPQFSIWGSRP